MTKKEFRLIENEKTLNPYLKDLMYKEVLELIHPNNENIEKDLFDYRDVIKALSRSYVLGKLRGQTK